MHIQVTILKILVSYPNGVASLDDLKRDMAILARSGKDWADHSRRLAAKIPDLSIFTMHLVERYSFGWRITKRGRAALEYMEARGPEVVAPPPVIEASFDDVEALLQERHAVKPNPRRRSRAKSGRRRRALPDRRA